MGSHDFQVIDKSGSRDSPGDIWDLTDLTSWKIIKTPQWLPKIGPHMFTKKVIFSILLILCHSKLPLKFKQN